jgi:thioesterase domain-containing protein
LAAVCKAHLLACSRYRGKRYEGAAVLFLAEAGRSRPERRWKSFCPRLRVESVPGDHYSMLRKPNVNLLAERLERYLAETTDGKK